MLQNEKSAVVIDLYLTAENNTVPAIAAKTGITEHNVHKIINKYLNGLEVKHEEI